MTSKMIGIAIALISFASGGAARAGYIVNIVQVGNDVVATGSGTINTSGLTDQGQASNGYAGIIADIGGLGLGPSSASAVSYEHWSGVTGPASFGVGNDFTATSGSGDLVALEASNNRFDLPVGYISGSQLNSTATFAGQTFNSLGLTTGTYNYSFGNGTDADFYTLNIGTAVPEPSSLVLMGIAGVAGLGYAWRRRRAQVAA